MIPSEFPEQFMSASVFTAVLHSKENNQTLLLEMRKYLSGKWMILTSIDSVTVRVNSLQELVHTQPSWCELIIPHEVSILWRGKEQRALLEEIYSQAAGGPRAVTVHLRLQVQGVTLETASGDSLQEVRRALDELVTGAAPVWLQTCCDCEYARETISGPGWDDRDELSCYRDAPEFAWQDVRTKGKFAGAEAIGTGAYFVSAFHTCAAWEARRSRGKNKG